MGDINPGIVGEADELVTDRLTAASMASGLVPAYATPSLVALMENAAYLATRPHLPPGQTTVGAELHIRHLAATPVGMRVRARAEVTQVDGRKVLYSLEAWDEVEKIGEGTHTRVIVDEARFNERFAKKRAQVSSL